MDSIRHPPRIVLHTQPPIFTLRLSSAVPWGRSRLGAPRIRAPSTITQYGYYYPLSPASVRREYGNPSVSPLSLWGWGVVAPSGGQSSTVVPSVVVVVVVVVVVFVFDVVVSLLLLFLVGMRVRCDTRFGERTMK